MTNKLSEALLEALRKSGTGEAKLIAVAETAQASKSVEEFVGKVKERVSTGTLDKIHAFLDSLPAEEKPDAKPEAERARRGNRSQPNP